MDRPVALFVLDPGKTHFDCAQLRCPAQPMPDLGRTADESHESRWAPKRRVTESEESLFGLHSAESDLTLLSG